MPRTLVALILLFFAFAQAAAAPMALCRHADAGAHAAALHSADHLVSVAAQLEEKADSASDQGGASGHAAASALAGALLPDLVIVPVPIHDVAALHAALPPSPLAGRVVPPLLMPPLA